MQNHDDDRYLIISAWIVGVSKFEAMDTLQAAGVRAGAVFNARDMHLDRHAQARGMMETVQFPPERNMGERPMIGRPWRLSRLPLAIPVQARRLARHNREVIQGLLGYDDARYAALEQSGIIGTRPTAPRPINAHDNG